jgi:hypothetical protein
MNMFNWQAPAGEHIVSDYFWVYFAITIPLTLLILSGWLVFYFFFQKPQTMIIHDLELNLPIKGEKYL